MCVSHEEGEVDPIRDLDIIHEELALKDLAQLEKLKGICELNIKKAQKEAKWELEMVEKC